MNDQNEAESFLNIYTRMLRIRHIEEEIATRYKQGMMRCPTHLSIGQECVPAVIGELTGPGDKAVSTHRCHAHYLGKGGDLKQMIAEIYGKQSGCSKGKGGSMHLIDQKAGFMGSSAIVGNSIPIGTGIGLALKLKNSNNISIVFLGEGATEEGVFYESMNFAALKNLNVAFICENNLYSVYSPLSVRQPPNRSITKIAESCGIKRTSIHDGNDIVDSYNVIKKTFNDIRVNGGPALLEFKTYRWREHCGPNYDNDIGYRTEEEFLEWQKRDPIASTRRYLESISENLKEQEHKLMQEIRKECIEAFEYAEQAAYPLPEEAYKEIFAES